MNRFGIVAEQTRVCVREIASAEKLVAGELRIQIAPIVGRGEACYKSYRNGHLPSMPRGMSRNYPCRD